MAHLIHMQTEEIQEVVIQMKRTIDQMDLLIDALSTKVSQIPWEGKNRDQYVGEFRQLTRQLQQANQNGQSLALRAQREMDEWMCLDQQHIQEYASIGTIIGGIATAFKDVFTGMYVDILKIKFRYWWSSQTREARISFLQKQHEKIAQKFGYEPIKVVIEEIDDLAGQDAKGYFNGQIISIDSDNLDHDNPMDLLNTVAHESRHQYQDESVKKFIKTGEIPAGMSTEQIESWKENQDNYVSPEDDFEGYYGQPIEVDARAYGSSYVNEYLLDEWK